MPPGNAGVLWNTGENCVAAIFALTSFAFKGKHSLGKDKQEKKGTLILYVLIRLRPETLKDIFD